jgi:twitching motility protein PilU
MTAATPQEILFWLKTMVEKGGSDLYVTVGAPPMLRVGDELLPLSGDEATPDTMRRLLADMTTHEQQAAFFSSCEFNMSMELRGLGRFRVNILQQRQDIALVIRAINENPPSPVELGIPDVVCSAALGKRGLILVTGATGSGKSTSLAALIDHRNGHLPGHILTVEDPVEYIHAHKRSLVTQREVGVDTQSFEAALKNALRQRPDVILVGEIRSLEVMRQVMNIAETGHLVMATLHANSALQAIDRVVNLFPNDERRHVLLGLSYNLSVVLSQRLMRSTSGGRIAAMEVLVNAPDIADALRVEDRESIKRLIKAGSGGSVDLDRCLLSLLGKGIISREAALAECESSNFIN